MLRFRGLFPLFRLKAAIHVRQIVESARQRDLCAIFLPLRQHPAGKLRAAAADIFARTDAHDLLKLPAERAA